MKRVYIIIAILLSAFQTSFAFKTNEISAPAKFCRFAATPKNFKPNVFAGGFKSTAPGVKRAN